MTWLHAFAYELNQKLTHFEPHDDEFSYNYTLLWYLTSMDSSLRLSKLWTVIIKLHENEEKYMLFVLWKNPFGAPRDYIFGYFQVWRYLWGSLCYIIDESVTIFKDFSTTVVLCTIICSYFTEIGQLMTPYWILPPRKKCPTVQKWHGLDSLCIHP